MALWLRLCLSHCPAPTQGRGAAPPLRAASYAEMTCVL